MKITHKTASRILWYESIGFLMLIALFVDWMNFTDTWHESAVESLAVLGVWLVVYYFTKRLVSRLYYLEGFLPVCAWCKKIKLMMTDGFRWRTIFPRDLTPKPPTACVPLVRVRSGTRRGWAEKTEFGKTNAAGDRLGRALTASLCA